MTPPVGLLLQQDTQPASSVCQGSAEESLQRPSPGHHPGV